MLERFVDDMAELSHFNTDQILLEDLKVEAMRLFGELACLVLLRHKTNIAPLGHGFNGLAVRSVVHQLVKVPCDLVRFALPPLLCVVVDVRLKLGTGRKADGAVNLNELHPAVKVESKEMAVHNVFSLRKERAHELATEGTGSSKVLGAELVLLLTRDLCVDVHCLRRERVVIVALMQLGWVVQIDFEYVMLFLIIPPIARSLVLECRQGITAIVVAHPLVLVIR